MALRKLNQRNQVTIPKSILEKMGTNSGDYFNIHCQNKQIILKPVTITEKDEMFTPNEWDKLEKLVARQNKEGKYTEYSNIKEAKKHLRKRMRRE